MRGGVEQVPRDQVITEDRACAGEQAAAERILQARRRGPRVRKVVKRHACDFLVADVALLLKPEIYTVTMDVCESSAK
ncbi:MAG: hypothetical protein JWO59_1789 [Chloroflexi bacterium]|nr:hypothetical protein [Chloroflexota bacterium]